MDETQTLEDVLLGLRDKNQVDEETKEKILKFVPLEKFLRSMEIVTLKEIQLIEFLPSKRKLWVVNGREHKYIIYPQKFCSCMNFYHQGVIKRKNYYCKHLLAQAIFENLNSSEKSITSIQKKDSDFDLLIENILF